jgi:hypothetical protein
MRSLWCRALLLFLAACSGRGHDAASPSPPAAPQPAPPPSAAAAPRLERVGGLLWDVTTPFVYREPKSPVRAAEYTITGEPRAELVAFYFGDQHVSVDAQIQAWLVQIEQPDGIDTAQKAKRGDFKVGPLTVSTVEVTGNYTGPVATPGVQVATAQDWLLLGAIVNGPKGPVMFKLIGPNNAVERARPAFERLLHSVRPE